MKEKLIVLKLKKVSVLGVEPRFSEPQSEVLTTRRYRHAEHIGLPKNIKLN